MHVHAGLALGLAVSTVVGAGAVPEPDDGWSRVRSERFEVLTDAGEPLARRVAERLETLRVALLRLFPPRRDGERRIMVMALAGRARFEHLAPMRRRRGDIAGFFQGGGEWDIIVARISTGPRGPFASIDHEYAHLVLNRSLPAQPLWVAEGLAELLSDAVLEDGEARLGSNDSEHAARVLEAPAPLAAVFGVRPESPEYLGGAGTAVFYSRSWALARWVVARQGLDRLRSFLEAVAEGRSPIAAFEERLAPLDATGSSLLDVPSGPLLTVPLGDVAIPALVADTPPRADVEHRLGDLLLHGGEVARARTHLERAIAASPDHVAARLGLSELHLRKGEWASARRELERALAVSPDDPGALLRDARLRVAEARSVGEPLAPEVEEGLCAQLEKALARAPDLHEAALLLAELRPQPYARRIASLEPVFEQDPGRTDVARMIAALRVKQRDIAGARQVLRRARDAAREPASRFLCDHLLGQLEVYADATAEVRGRLVHLDCRPDGSLRFVVGTADGVLRLEAPSARSFLVYGRGEASGERELTCGSQDRPVVMRYQRMEGEAHGLEGIVLWLAFPDPPGGD